MLVDSDIFIDLIRKRRVAKEAFATSLYGQSTSIIVKLELDIGMASKQSIRVVNKLLQNLEIKVLSLNEDISRVAEEIIENFYHSHGIGIEDALIAGTAIVYNEELVTRNRKHFQFIPNLKIIAPY